MDINGGYLAILRNMENEEEFMAIGIYNQFIYVNRSTKTVIVKNSANKNYYDRFNNPYASKMVAIELFREIAHINKLQTSE